MCTEHERGLRMNTKQLKRSAFLAAFSMIIILATLTTATYAWFTITAVTNVEPMDGAVSRGDSNLLISASRNGPFDRECKLSLVGDPQSLRPISTADLSRFYEAAAQDTGGIISLYKDAAKKVDSYCIHGTVYLRSEYNGCDVYLRRSGMDLGKDGQMLAAMRLGLKIETKNGTETVIFRLDELGNTGNAASAVTVASRGQVVSSVRTDGTASFVRDPAVDIADYFAEEGDDEEAPEPGKEKLCTLEMDEVASVEFWLYMEGCDDNCVVEAQNRDTGLQLAFAGVTVKEA